MRVDVDRVARRLAQVGRSGRGMPRGAFEIEGQSHPVVSAGGAPIGRVLPGHGLVLPRDLRSMGITRPVPGVIERSRFMRAMDRILDDRGTITSMADLRAAHAKKPELTTFTDTFTPNGNGIWSQQYDRNQSTNFGAAASPNNATAGAYNAAMQVPTGSDGKYLTGIATTCTGVSGAQGWSMAVLVDVVSATGNIDATLTTLQSFSPPALTRYTSGIGVYMCLGVANSNSDSAATTNTIGYTNQAGTAGQSTAVVATSTLIAQQIVTDASNNGQLPLLPLASGDFGVRKFTSFQATAGSAGPALLGMMLLHPLLWLLPIEEPNTTLVRDARAEPELLVPLPVGSDSKLGFYTTIWSTGTTSGVDGVVNFVFDCCAG